LACNADVKILGDYFPVPGRGVSAGPEKLIFDAGRVGVALGGGRDPSVDRYSLHPFHRINECRND
jgi:hypothetical protein